MGTDSIGCGAARSQPSGAEQRVCTAGSSPAARATSVHSPDPGHPNKITLPPLPQVLHHVFLLGIPANIYLQQLQNDPPVPSCKSLPGKRREKKSSTFSHKYPPSSAEKLPVGRIQQFNDNTAAYSELLLRPSQPDMVLLPATWVVGFPRV